MHKIKVEQFEGPLDLLLQLIEEQKLEITKVSLAQVTEQYIEILNDAAQDQVTAEELADFLVIASRLLLIKSKALMPYLDWGEEDEGEELSKQLKIYKEYLDAMKVIQKLISKKSFAYSREKMITYNDIEFSPPPKLTADRLGEVYEEIIKRLLPILRMPSEMIRKTINIQEKISQIRKRIFEQATSRFSEILSEAKDRTEVIVSFLALLELIKQRQIAVKQDKNFEDILIEKFVE